MKICTFKFPKLQKQAQNSFYQQNYIKKWVFLTFYPTSNPRKMFQNLKPTWSESMMRKEPWVFGEEPGIERVIGCSGCRSMMMMMLRALHPRGKMGMVVLLLLLGCSRCRRRCKIENPMRIGGELMGEGMGMGMRTVSTVTSDPTRRRRRTIRNWGGLVMVILIVDTWTIGTYAGWWG